MCQICPVSDVPYLWIEVHVQTFAFMLSVCRGFLLEESSHLTFHVDGKFCEGSWVWEGR